MTRYAAFTVVFLLIALTTAPARAADIFVTTFTDEDGTGPDCSLREAVQAADSDSAYGGCIAGSGFDEIGVPDGVYTLTLGSQITIDSSLRIYADPDTATIRAAATANSVNYRVFLINSGITVTLNALIIENGGSTSFIDNGGCIASTANELFMSAVTIQNCNAVSEGGGLYIGAGTATLSGITLTGNRSGDDGGAIRAVNAALTITGGLISGNTAIGFLSTSARGGGIDYEGSSFSLTGVTVSGNTVSDLDGGDALGGGLAVRILPSSATGSIVNSAIEGNFISTVSGVAQGGAIYKFGDGTLSVSTTCIVGNLSPAVYNLQPTVPISAQGNWWGNAWGPRILGATASTGSLVSTGDSIDSTGFTSIVVNGTPTLNYGDDDGTPIPVGDWITTLLGGCQECSPTSSITPGARVCAP